MRKLFYLAQWFVRARFFGRRAPLQTVLFISDICNLRCKHCSVYELKNPHNMTYEQVREHLQYSYDQGSRFVDFEGGEVTIPDTVTAVADYAFANNLAVTKVIFSGNTWK